MRQMLVLAAVPPIRLNTLRAGVGDICEFIPVTHWAEVVETIRHRPVEIAVVDPLVGGQSRAHEIERLRVLFPSLPLIVYTTLSPEAAGVLLALGRIGIRKVIFARFDDSPGGLRAAFREEWASTASQQVLQALSNVLDGLPQQLRWALESALHAPADAPTVSDLAQRAQLGRRTCERWFARSGLPSPKMVLVLARLLYAHRLLLDPGYTVEDVALKLGYSKARTLQLHLKDVFGLTAGELRLSLSTEEALQRVTSRYFPTAGKVAS